MAVFPHICCLKPGWCRTSFLGTVMPFLSPLGLRKLETKIWGVTVHDELSKHAHLRAENICLDDRLGLDAQITSDRK